MARLTRFSRVQWREWAKILRPDITDADFAVLWARYLKLRRRKRRHVGVLTEWLQAGNQ